MERCVLAGFFFFFKYLFCPYEQDIALTYQRLGLAASSKNTEACPPRKVGTLSDC